ncbi:SUKH-3 immunity protein [Micromonospora citrea]|uniref:SUKH-3 immunity protein n=1 Tax=Micromonospora citrea TaxID=47855 RepID=A0A1C6TUN0_9ACTN|nr:SUKH-3 immunity protein [Micromonospora citrea]
MNGQVLNALLEVGWFPGRMFDTLPWEQLLSRAGVPINGRALEIWKEFGELRIRRSTVEKPSSLKVDPVEASSGLPDDADRLRSDYGEVLSPIGMWSVQYPSYVAESGWVMAIGPGWDWLLGRSFSETLDLVILGVGEIRCINVTRPGIRPFPPDI